MRNLFIAIFATLPLFGMAQNVWEKPQTTAPQEETTKKKSLFESNKKAVDPKYLAGAVPVVDGKVTFTLDKDIPGKSAQEIYDIVFATLEKMTKEENQFKTSQVAIVNKQDHIIGARFKEWLVFQNTFLSLDRTIFNYTVIATCTNEHLNVTISRISYAYEMDRGVNDGMEMRAEEWITDENALNKKKDNLSKYSGKFRRKTIDRKDNIFETLLEALK
jgi:colicin import membrane protein